MTEKLLTIAQKIDVSKITSDTDEQVKEIISLISHYGLYIMGAAIIVTLITMGIRSRRGGDVEITPIVIEFVILTMLIAINANGLAFIGL